MANVTRDHIERYQERVDEMADKVGLAVWLWLIGAAGDELGCVGLIAEDRREDDWQR